MKVLFSLLTLACFIIGQGQDAFVQLSDLEILDNTKWTGQLTYKDYQSGEWTPIDATMQISIKGNIIKTVIQYSYEPHKNRTSKVKLKNGGTYYGNERVVSNEVLNGFRIIKTMFKEKDNNRAATLFITHKFNKNSYSITKDVLYDDSSKSITRNRYQFTKL
jgi:hypothetical protein